MKINEVKKYLKEIKFCDKAKVKRLSDGYSNHNFLIETEKDKFVLRCNMDEVTSKNRLYNEHVVLKFLEEEKIDFVPRSTFYDKKNKRHIISFICGRRITYGELRKKHVKSFARNLAKATYLKFDNFEKFCKKNNYNKIDKKKKKNSFEIYTLTPFRYVEKNLKDKQLVDWLREKVEINSKLKFYGRKRKWFAHGDIASNMMVYRNNIYFIDWELARFMSLRRDPTGLGYAMPKYSVEKNIRDAIVKEFSKESKIDSVVLNKNIDVTIQRVALNDILWAIERFLKMKMKKLKGWKKYYKLSQERIKNYDRITKIDF